MSAGKTNRKYVCQYVLQHNPKCKACFEDGERENIENSLKLRLTYVIPEYGKKKLKTCHSIINYLSSVFYSNANEQGTKSEYKLSIILLISRDIIPS